MFFSIKTVALIAALPGLILAGPIEERSSSLCNQQYYGATGFPWQANSQPGSFCGSKKPSNSGQWKNIPTWDGGDSVRCSTTNGRKNFKVCNGGNPKAPLPKQCNPPHNLPGGPGQPTPPGPGGNKPGPGGGPAGPAGPAGPGGPGGPGGPAPPSTSSAVVSCGTTTSCTAPLCSTNNWFSLSCLNPSNWASTCVSTPKVCAGSGTTTTVAPAATFTSTTAVVPSSVASAIIAGVNTTSAVTSPTATTLSFATTYTDSVSSAIATTIVTSSSSAAAVATSAAAVDPLSYPVCEMTYQVTYTNYTMVAPNGVWAGMTVGSATQDASYMTYTLANTVDDCLAACDQIEGCVFVNTYYDVNAQEADLPKHTPGVLTCSMYSQCVGTDKNDNFGGQDDPNTIVDSNGYCKSGACSS